jgi:hypothetical protein
MDIYTRLEQDTSARDAKAKKWAFWAEFLHDPELPPATWTVDGETMDVPLDEEALHKAVFVRNGRTKARITVSAPLHLALADIVGWSPPYITE